MMGCPSARIQEGRDSPCNKVSEGVEIFYIPARKHGPAKATNATKKGYVLEHYPSQQRKENLASGASTCSKHYRHPEEPSLISIPKLDQGSPSDSNSSSKIFNFGSSPSSSISSASSLDEIENFALGELTLPRGTGYKEKPFRFSSPEEIYHRCYTPSKTWNDSETQFKCLPEAEIFDSLTLEQEDDLQIQKSFKDRQNFSNTKHSEFERKVHGVNECQFGQAPASNLSLVVEEEKTSFDSSLFPTLHAIPPSKHTSEGVITYPGSISNPRRAHRGLQSSAVNNSIFKLEGDYNKCEAFDINEDALLGRCYTGLQQRRADLHAFGQKGLNEIQCSAIDSLTCKNPRLEAFLGCNVGCNAMPREATNADTLLPQLPTFPSLYHFPTSLRTSLSDRPNNGPNFTGPGIRLNGKHSVDRACAKFSGNSYSAKAQMSIGKTEHTRKFISRGLSDKLDASCPGAGPHCYYGSHKETKPSLASLSKRKLGDKKSSISASNGHYTETVDAFTPYLSPPPTKGPVYKEGSKANPYLGFNCKSQWDCRSKNSREKETRIKPAGKNPKGMPARSRSLSLPKTRPGVQVPKSETLSLWDKIFTSPRRVRSSMQAGDSTTNRPCNKRSELKDDHPVERSPKGRMSSILSDQNKIVGVASNPLSSIGYNDGEVACEPSIPASNAGHCRQTPLVASGVESANSFCGKASGLISHPSSISLSCRSLAQIRCTFVDGMPLYTMTNADSGEVMLAKACWQENHSSRETCQWQYLFYSGQARAMEMGSSGRWSWMKKKHKTTTNLNCVMKVSQCRDFPAKKALRPSRVLEFVLHDCSGEEISPSQGLKSRATNKPYLWSRSSTSSLTHACSPHSQFSSPDRQREEKLIGLCDSSDKTITVKNAPKFHEVNSRHRQTLSLDGWSESEPPAFDPSSTSFSSAQAELAAIVIKFSAEIDSKGYDIAQFSRTGQGWGSNFLNGTLEYFASEPDLPRTAQKRKSTSLERTALQRHSYDSLLPQSDSNTVSGSYKFAQGMMDEEADHVSTPEGFKCARSTVSVRRDMSVTLLLPTKEHSLPKSSAKGPSSLIQRWRSGGLCECGGWDLGCGISVVSSECIKKEDNFKVDINGSAICDGPFHLFSQGTRPELMISLSPVKEGEFQLIFQKNLPHLQVFATAVAMLHCHQLDLSHSWPSSLSGKPDITMSPSPGNNWRVIPNFKEQRTAHRKTRSFNMMAA